MNPAVPPGELEGDLEFLMRAALKVETIREDLGKVGPVIAAQVEEAMLGRRRRLDTAQTEREAGPARRMLRFERELRAQLQRLHEQLHESRRELRLSPENLQAVVAIGLGLAGRPPLREATVPGLWPDPSGRRKSCPVFHLPPLSGSWAACSEGLRHPHTGEIRPIVFDHELAGGRDEVVLAHLNHRLVQLCLRLLRSEIWSQESRKQLHRVTARLVPNDALDAPAVIAHGRLVILGARNHRLHEELLAAGGLLREGRFTRMNRAGELRAALDAALPDEPPAAIKQRLAAIWPAHHEALRQALEARMRERTAGLQKLLEERAGKEAADVTALLTELQQSIRAELAAPQNAQLELWTDPEREQRERNRASLHARLESIPGEIEQEARAIRARYADPAPRLFPVAVTYLVPERLAREAGERG
jgi:cobalamin biosynthesis Mg chelatase CobN